MRAIAIVVALFCCGCSSGAEDGFGGGGGYGGAGGAEPACGQSCQDAATMFGVIDTVSFLYNQNLAGQQVGLQDLSADCPLGGSVHITGSTGFDMAAGVLSLDLVYDMSQCRASGTDYDMTFTGPFAQLGTVEQMGQISVAYTSSELRYDGTVPLATPTSGLCDVALQERRLSDGSGYDVMGTLCGRSVSF